MINDFKNIIDSTCDRFNYAISQLDVIAWLENFDPDDRGKAIIVLNNFEYYTTSDIINEFENGLESIIKEKKEDQEIYLIPVGLLGKSGASMIYYLKKTPSYANSKITLIDNSTYSENKEKRVVKISELADNCKIVLIDDFAGTGMSIYKFYLQIKKLLPPHEPIALTISYLDEAEKYLNKKDGIKIVGNKRIPAFSARGSVFGYYPRMEAIREFCFKYGEKLYPLDKYKKNKMQPLGFSNSQALIGFEHSIPNNTLPIIWADIKRKDNGKHWIPLFPRRGDLIIKKSKEFKQNQLYWTSIAYRLGVIGSLLTTDEKYGKNSTQLISLIYLKKKRKNIFNICQILGINLKEYDEIINEGRIKNIFDENGDLTQQAQNIYDQIRKKIKFQNKGRINSDPSIPEDMVYIPKTFRGSS